MASSKTIVVASNPLELEYTTSEDPSEDERAIFDCLATYLPAESSVTADEAVQQIIALFPEDLDTTGTNFIYRFWQLVFCIGSQLDCQQKPMQRFITLLRALEILPDEIQGGANPGRSSHASRLFYVSAFRDQWNSTFSFSTFLTLGLARGLIPEPTRHPQQQEPQFQVCSSVAEYKWVGSIYAVEWTWHLWFIRLGNYHQRSGE